MEILSEAYLTGVHELDNNFTEGAKQFRQTMQESEKFRKNRAKNVAKAATILLKQPKKYRLEKPLTPSTVQTWWEIFVQERYPDDKCLEYFKCSRKTYIYLTKTLRPHIEPRLGATAQLHSLNMLKGVSVEKQVAITLHKLARCVDYALVSATFGIHKSTVHKIFYKAINGINKHLLNKVIHMPRREEARKIAEEFEEKCKIPQVIGAIGSMHVPISPSIGMVPRFQNKNNYPSFIFQGVVDSNYRFRDVSVRHPGSVDDRQVLEDSNIYKFADRVIPTATKNVNGAEIPYKIAGATSYPLLPWLLTGYFSPSSQAEAFFNEHLDEIKSHATTAFDRLKARFIILSQTIDVSFKVAPQIIAACCAIHNICEKNEDPFSVDWLEEMKVFSEKFPQPCRTKDLRVLNKIDIDHRDAIRDFLETEILLENAAFGYVDHENIGLLTEEIE